MSQSEDREFEDAFEEIEQDEDSYQQKSKKINKRFGKGQAAPKKAKKSVRNPNRNKPNKNKPNKNKQRR